MNKEIIKIIIQVLIYALGLLGAYFGVTSLTSCSSTHNIQSSGKAWIITHDTTIVKHNGYVRSKNYTPYEQNN